MQPLFEYNFSVISDVGRSRKNNEDYTTYFIPSDSEELKKNGSLFIVADGVGGAAKGEVASKYAADTVVYEYFNNTNLPPAERLEQAIKKANRDIYIHSQENGNFMRMATTMVAALILQNNLIIAHVGDSRLYLIREGKIKQVTRDHSVVAEMVRSGAMTEEEARMSKAKNRITRSIGGDPDVHVDVSNPIPLKLGDRILICSDGLTRYLDGENLLAAAIEGEVKSLAEKMVQFANDQGGADNTSVILLEMVIKAKGKKPIKVKVPPEKLGWDEMETQYPTQPLSKTRKIPLWAKIAAGIAAFILVALVWILLVPKNDKSAETPIEPQVEETILATSEPSQTPTQPTEIAPGNSPAVEVLDASKSSEDWKCVHQVISGETIGELIGKFYKDNDESPDPKKNDYYLFYKNCEIDGEYVNCEGDPQLIEDSNDLSVDVWFVVYSSDQEEFIYSTEACLKNKGKIFNISSTGGNE